MMGFMDAVYRVSPACIWWKSASACMPSRLSPAGLAPSAKLVDISQFSTWHHICNAYSNGVHTRLLYGPHQMLTEATYLSKPCGSHFTNNTQQHLTHEI